MKGDPVTAINKGKEIVVTDFDDYDESSSTIMSSSSNGVVVEEIYTCPICSKAFNSTKAVHGHMRSHPDRSYRGMAPPKKSSRPIRIKTCSDDQAVVGCSGSVNGDGVEDELMVSAAFGLMLLATGDDRYRTLPRPKKDGIRVSEVSLQSNKKIEIMICVENVNINGDCRSATGKKRTRENDEADSRASKAAEKVSIEDLSVSNHGVKAVAASTPSRLHICRECNKAFASGQALGGHKRYHFKPRVADVVAVDLARVADVVAADLTRVANVVAEDQVPVYRSFDLNEMPADI